MRFIYSSFLVFIATALYAQTSNLRSAGSKEVIVYQSPNNGDTYVQARTTLIIRPDHARVHGHSAADFYFNVRGELSGIHTGKVVISDDKETVIFEPVQPFTLNELITVTLSISDEKIISPITYNFRITPLSDEEQLYGLRQLRNYERKEIELFQKEAESKKTNPVIQVSPNDSLPFPIIRIDTLISGKVAPGDVFIGLSGGGISKSFGIVDNSGLPVFKGQNYEFGCSSFRKWPKNNMYSYFTTDTIAMGNDIQGKGILLDSNFAIIDSFRCGNGLSTNFHEFQLLPNGHVIVIAYDQRDTDMTVVLNDPQASKRARVFGGVIQELDLEKRVVFQWSTWDHFNITDATAIPLRAPIIDWVHLNSVELDTDGNLIASFRHLDEITKINRQTGDVIWRWGGKNNKFLFEGDTLPFLQQHDVRRIANGHITVFDNGSQRKTMWGDGSYHDTVYTRVLEYELDESKFKARSVWEFTDMPFSSAGGECAASAERKYFYRIRSRTFSKCYRSDIKWRKGFSNVLSRRWV